MKSTTGLRAGESATDQQGLFSGFKDVFLVVALMLVFAVTLFPRRGQGTVQLIPVVATINDIRQHGVGNALLAAGANVVLFMPVGAALVARLPLRRAILFAAILSAAIEATQLLIPGRTTSADDVLTNAAGAALGYVVTRSLWRSLRQSR
jgi:glycopeptide antibiotics resistance protein